MPQSRKRTRQRTLKNQKFARINRSENKKFRANSKVRHVDIQNCEELDEFEVMQQESTPKTISLHAEKPLGIPKSEESDAQLSTSALLRDKLVANVKTVFPAKMIKNNKAQPSKAPLKHNADPGTSKCTNCEKVLAKLEKLEEQNRTIIKILSEHKVLLGRISDHHISVENMLKIFPINTDEKLKEFDTLLLTQGAPYIRQMTSLFGGNIYKNLHHVFGHNIIMSYNVDGTMQKKSFRSLKNVFTATMDVISSFSDNPDKTLRDAFQKQKKKYHKQTGRNKAAVEKKHGFANPTV